MILGFGNDLLQLERFYKVHAAFADRFAKRILHVKEHAVYLQKPEEKRAQFLAKKFCIKEAASKALGTGMRQGVSFNEFCELRDEFNKPVLSLHGKAQAFEQAKLNNLASKNWHSVWHIALSDEAGLVLANVIWEAREA